MDGYYHEESWYQFEEERASDCHDKLEIQAAEFKIKIEVLESNSSDNVDPSLAMARDQDLKTIDLLKSELGTARREKDGLEKWLNDSASTKNAVIDDLRNKMCNLQNSNNKMKLELDSKKPVTESSSQSSLSLIHI